MGERIRVLITVKTYPLPSEKYEELVCTAGLKEDGNFIRLYPIDYRYRAYEQWYAKYQWIEVEVEKQTRDPRPESYRPVGDIKPIGEPISTKDNWSERKRFVLAKAISSMCDLEKKSQKEVSLGIVKPAIVNDLVIEATDRDWKPQWIAHMNQMRLFAADRKPLEKIPYKFSYVFRCLDKGCNGHTKMINDWEVGQLYRSMRDKFDDEKIACEKVKEKFFNHICGSSVDTHFFVGTTLQHASWIIIGTFWPKKESE